MLSPNDFIEKIYHTMVKGALKVSVDEVVIGHTFRDNVFKCYIDLTSRDFLDLENLDSVAETIEQYCQEDHGVKVGVVSQMPVVRKDAKKMTRINATVSDEFFSKYVNFIKLKNGSNYSLYGNKIIL